MLFLFLLFALVLERSGGTYVARDLSVTAQGTLTYPVSVLQFASTIIHGSGRAAKNRDDVSDVRWTQDERGGGGGGGGSFQQVVNQFIVQSARFECSAVRSRL